MTLPPHMVTNLSRFIWELLGFTLEVPYPRKFCSATPFPGGSDSKASAYNAGHSGSIPGLGRSPGEGNGNPLQDSCLENPMDGGAWWATVHGVAKSQTRLSNLTYAFGEGNGNPLQYSCLENSMNRGTGWVTVHGVTMSQARLSG